MWNQLLSPYTNVNKARVWELQRGAHFVPVTVPPRHYRAPPAQFYYDANLMTLKSLDTLLLLGAWTTRVGWDWAVGTVRTVPRLLRIGPFKDGLWQCETAVHGIYWTVRECKIVGTVQKILFFIYTLKFPLLWQIYILLVYNIYVFVYI